MKNTEYEALSEIFLFKDMDKDTALSFLEECSRRDYSQGEIIHSVENPFRGIGALLIGKARIVSGGETLLRILECGDIFGAATVFDLDESNRTSVIAYGKCSVLHIPERVIVDIITNDKNAAMRYIAFLSDRVNFLNSRISTLTAGDAVSKAAGYILSLDADDDGIAEIGDSLTHIASKLNMGRASLYRTIDRLASEGFIKRDKNTLTILDRKGLEDIIFKKRSR